MVQNSGQDTGTGTMPPRSNRTRRNITIGAITVGGLIAAALLYVFALVPFGNWLDHEATGLYYKHACDKTYSVNGETRKGTEVINGTGRVVSFKHDDHTEQYEQKQPGGSVTYTTRIDGVERHYVNATGHNTMPAVVEDCKP